MKVVVVSFFKAFAFIILRKYAAFERALSVLLLCTCHSPTNSSRLEEVNVVLKLYKC